VTPNTQKLPAAAQLCKGEEGDPANPNGNNGGRPQGPPALLGCKNLISNLAVVCLAACCNMGMSYPRKYAQAKHCSSDKNKRRNLRGKSVVNHNDRKA
jgi:hypothetical protein